MVMSAVPNGSEALSHEPAQAVYPDVLVSVAGELERAVHFIDGEPSGPSGESLRKDQANLTRSMGRKLERGELAGKYFHVIGGIAVLMLDRPEQEAERQEAFVGELLKPLDAVGHFTPTELPLAVLANVEQMRTLDTMSSTVSRRLGDEVADDIAGQYQLMRLLARSQVDLKDSADPQDKAVQALQILTTFEALRHDDGHGIIESAATSLEEGKFDSLLATTMLSDAFNEPQGSRDKSQDELVDLIELIVGLEQNEASAVIAELSTSKHLRQWPKPYKKILDSYRLQYQKGLQKNQAVHTEYLTKYNCAPGHTTEEAMRQAIGHLAADMLKLIGSQSDGPMSKRVGAKVLSFETNPQVAKQRRRAAAGRRPGKQVEAASPEPETQIEADTAKKGRDIVYIDAHGEEAPEGSDAYEKLIDTYANKHPEATGLADDIRLMLERISKIDLSQGGTRGVGSVGRRVKIGERYVDTLYELDPNALTGLATSSALANRIRVMFTFLEGAKKVGVIKIMHENDVPKFGKQYNIMKLARRSSSSGKRN